MGLITQDLTPSQRGQYAEKLVIDYLRSNSWKVTLRKDVNEIKTGYDLKAIKNGEIRYIEVKGTSKPFSVPDMHENEFDLKRKKLKATHPYIIGEFKKREKSYFIYNPWKNYQ